MTFASCTSKEVKPLSSEDAELLASVKRVQDQTGLSNAEMESAIIRGAKVLAVFDGAFKEGLITEEDMRRMPALFAEFEEQHFDSEALASALAFAVLKAHHDGDVERLLPFLRNTLADHYRDVSRRNGDEHLEFMKRVEELAATDEELRKLLKEPG